MFTPGMQWDSLIEAPTAEHSAKPEAFHEMIEAYFPTYRRLNFTAAVPRVRVGPHGDQRRTSARVDANHARSRFHHGR